jgi:hypothetical protein
VFYQQQVHWQHCSLLSHILPNTTILSL